jgi:hypothetical protein
MGAAAFTAERAPVRKREKVPSGRGKLSCDMGSIRQRRKRSGSLPVLL